MKVNMEKEVECCVKQRTAMTSHAHTIGKGIHIMAQHLLHMVTSDDNITNHAHIIEEVIHIGVQHQGKDDQAMEVVILVVVDNIAKL